jgi:hypothetical protein
MVSEDPDRTWHDVGEYLLHDNNAYAGWYAEVGRTSPKFEVLTDPRELRAAGTYQICTPAEAVALASAAGPDHLLSLHPLAGGMPVQHAFAAVQLFLDEVLPAVRAAAAPTAPATPNVEAPLSAPSRG